MKRSKIKRTAKKGTLSWWKKKLWKVFALYIKERDGWTCITCGNKGYGQSMHAGHYIAKGACSNKYYFHEKNVHAQCARCNLWLEGNRPKYRAYILKKYGEEVLLDLETNYGLPHPWKESDYQLLIEKYKQCLKELRHSSGHSSKPNSLALED